MNKGLPVKGYTDQSDHKVQIVNEFKEVEEDILRTLDFLRSLENDPDANEVGVSLDYDALKLGAWKIKEAFMWINRGVFNPQRIRLSTDGASE